MFQVFFRLFYYSFHSDSNLLFCGMSFCHEFWRWGLSACFGWEGSVSGTFPLCTLLGVVQFLLLGPLRPQPRILSYVGRGLGVSVDPVSRPVHSRRLGQLSPNPSASCRPMMGSGAAGGSSCYQLASAHRGDTSYFVALSKGPGSVPPHGSIFTTRPPQEHCCDFQHRDAPRAK